MVVWQLVDHTERGLCLMCSFVSARRKSANSRSTGVLALVAKIAQVLYGAHFLTLKVKHTSNKPLKRAGVCCCNGSGLWDFSARGPFYDY
jgi:hypothetical protein